MRGENSVMSYKSLIMLHHRINRNQINKRHVTVATSLLMHNAPFVFLFHSIRSIDESLVALHF